MAKVSGPLMSMDARGGFAGALVFSGWKGRPTVRQLVTPANPKSANQETSRNRVRCAGTAQRFANLSLEMGDGRLTTDKTAIQAITPSGYAWNGYLVEGMIGAGGLNYTAANTAWGLLTAPEKTAWNSAADALTPAFPQTNQVTAGGAAGTPLTSGEGFYHYQYGLYVLGIAAAPTATPPVYA